MRKKSKICKAITAFPFIVLSMLGGSNALYGQDKPPVYAPKISGYMQIQSYFEDVPDGNSSYLSKESGLRVRRARLKASGSVDPFTSYELQINANDSAVSLEDAFISLQILPWAALQVGRFTMPFGEEVYMSSKKNPFIERSRYWSFIFSEKRNIGAMITLGNSSLFTFQFGYFRTFNTSTEQKTQDMVARAVFYLGSFTTGISAYYDDKTLSGKITEVEKKGNYFIKYKQGGLIATAEISSLFISPSAFEFTGSAKLGMHVYVDYTLNDRWVGLLKYSYLKLDSSVSINDDEIHDFVAGVNFHISKKSRIQFNYNPSLHEDGTWAHAVLGQFQAEF